MQEYTQIVEYFDIEHLMGISTGKCLQRLIKCKHYKWKSAVLCEYTNCDDDSLIFTVQ